jgi:hypothetical protein
VEQLSVLLLVLAVAVRPQVEILGFVTQLLTALRLVGQLLLVEQKEVLAVLPQLEALVVLLRQV